MKSRSEIWYAMLEEIGMACSVSTSRDRETVARRVEAEGESFFTITLPAFEKDLIRSITDGEIPTDAFAGFSRRKIGNRQEVVRGVPELFGGFLDLLFTSREVWLDDRGSLQEEILPRPVLRPVDTSDQFMMDQWALACKGLRQLLLLFSKEKNLCDQSKIDLAIQDYIKTDNEVTLPLWIAGRVLSLRAACSVIVGE